MHDGQTDPLISKLQRVREAFRVARDVKQGTDGDPIAAAQLLAGIINGGAEAIAEAAKSGKLHDKILEAAPMLVTARMATPEAFEEMRGLLEDIGAPPLLDDLPTAWSVPPWNVASAASAGSGAFDAAYGVGLEIGAAARELADKADEEEQEPGPEPAVNLGLVLRESLSKHGVTLEADQACEVVADIMDALGYEEITDSDDQRWWRDPNAELEAVPVVQVPVTPWMIDFQPVPAAQHRDTLPDDVRRRYSESLQIMIKQMGLHPDAIVHAIFVSDEKLAQMEDPVALEACDALRLQDAWAHCPDPAGWGPSPDRPFAVWYPVVKTAVTGPF